MVAVGTVIAHRPPRRSRRAAFPHRAPVEGRTRSSFGTVTVLPASIRRLAASVACKARHRVRSMRCRSPSLRPAAFPPQSPPPTPLGFVRGFTGTMQPSDSSPVPRQLRLLDFLSWPGIAEATAGQARSPKFRRVPFARNGVFDLGRASAPRITVPHMLPSTCVTVSAPANLKFRGSIAHSMQSLCTLRHGRHLPQRNTHYQAGATPYLGRTFTGWNTPACLAHHTHKRALARSRGEQAGIEGLVWREAESEAPSRP